MDKKILSGFDNNRAVIAKIKLIPWTSQLSCMAIFSSFLYIMYYGENTSSLLLWSHLDSQHVISITKVCLLESIDILCKMVTFIENNAKEFGYGSHHSPMGVI